MLGSATKKNIHTRPGEDWYCTMVSRYHTGTRYGGRMGEQLKELADVRENRLSTEAEYDDAT